MDSAFLLEEGRLEDALAALKDEVRKAPSRVELRVRLFALHCLLGRFDRASGDLAAAKALDPSWMIPAQVYGGLIAAELLRREIFAGRAKPLVMGEPDTWLACNVQALAEEAKGKSTEVARLRHEAWEAAPAVAGRVDGHDCQWLSDADRRIGPVLEACLDGRYYWIPFERLQRIEISPPEFLVELMWLPAKLLLRGGAELAAQLPARYPGTESSTDGALCLGRRTEWPGGEAGSGPPLGQKLIECHDADFGLLSCRVIEFESEETTASSPSTS